MDEQARRLTARWRERQRAGVDPGTLGLEEWAEFEMAAPDGSRFRAVYYPDFGAGHAHIALRGERGSTLLPTGFQALYVNVRGSDHVRSRDIVDLAVDGLWARQIGERTRSADRPKAEVDREGRLKRIFHEAIAAEPLVEPGYVKPGAFVVQRDESGQEHLHVRQGDKLSWVVIAGDVVEKIRDLIHVRDGLRALERAKASRGDEETVEASRAALETVYEAFVARWGSVAEAAASEIYRHDPDSAFVARLEEWDLEAGRFRRSSPLARAPVAVQDAEGETLEAAAGEDGGPGAAEPSRDRVTPKTVRAGHATEQPVEVPGTAAPTRSPAEEPARDFRITSDLREWLETSSKARKFEANVAALRRLASLEGEGRVATPDDQTILARWTGWGQFPQLFDPRLARDAEWGSRQRTIEELLGGRASDAYDRARASTLNAHYTHPEIAREIWRVVERFGIDGGRILEPAVGSGSFLGTAPDGWLTRKRSLVAGIELDPVTAAIARRLYPSARIEALGFEAAMVPRDYFDLAISNVPFGEYKIRDERVSAMYGRDLRVHNYFFAAAVERVRPGGIVAFITSAGTLDAAGSERFRRQLGERANFLGAIRLPQTAFRRSAGTDVTTDVIFLERRAEGEPANHRGAWFRTAETAVKGMSGRALRVNEYFASRPGMLAGTLVEDKLHPGRAALDGRDMNVVEALRRAAALLPERQARIRRETPATTPFGTEAAAVPEGLKLGGYVVLETDEGAKLFVRERAGLVEVPANARRLAVTRSMLELRDAARSLLAEERQCEDGDERLLEARRRLNDCHDRFVSQWGELSDRRNAKVLNGDPDRGLLASLETIDERGRATKAPIFFGRVVSRPAPVERAGSAADALAIAIAERGRVDLARVAGLLGIDGEDGAGRAAAELAGERLIFLNPATRAWETADEYLSGDVVTKLEIARAASELERPLAANVEALEAVQPEWIPARDIGARLGASWIPADVYQDFAREVSEASMRLRYIPPAAQWVVVERRWGRGSLKDDREFGTPDVPAYELLALALNFKQPTVWRGEGENRRVDAVATEAAREKQHKIAARFKEWIFEDEARLERLERIYNGKFNRTRLREFSGEPLPLPGLATSWRGDPATGGRTLRPHQYAAIRRIGTGRNTLLAHVVGAGKTAEMIAGLMELRRLGLARKPMMVVPNHLVRQIGRDFRDLYPGANILVQSEGDFSKDRRAEFLGRIATGTWDAVIVAHTSFGLIPVSRETEAAFLREQIHDFEQSLWMMEKEDAKAVKKIESSKNRLKDRLGRLLAKKRDDGLTFEELGVDQLFVDESHAFKNLAFSTKLTRVAGLSDSASERAEDMYLKCRFVESIRGEERGVCWSTGTPLTNSIAEQYTLHRFLAGASLKRKGLGHFDAWVGNFAETVTGWETGVTGAFQVKTRFSEFCNLPELLTDFRSYADVKTAEMLDLPRPELGRGSAIAVISPQTGLQRAVMAWVDKRVAAIRDRRVEPWEDNMLRVSTDCRKLSLDPRLIDEGLPGSRTSKAARAAETIHHVWEATREARATQIVFSDLGTPGEAKGFSVYEETKRLLVERGVPAGEIAFIHDCDSQEKKLGLFDRVNAGEVRVVFGSSRKLGAGANVQRRLVALHHLDVPWVPADIEQRNGRMLRQGNLCDRVYEFRYITQGDSERSGFDAYMWELVGRKARFIGQVMRGDGAARRAEDIAARPLTYAEYSAIAHGNPLLLEKARAEAEIERLERLETAWHDSARVLRIQARELPEAIARAKRRLERLESDWREVGEAARGEFRMEVGGVAVTDREEAGRRLQKLSASREFHKTGRMDVGRFAGRRVWLVDRELGDVAIRLEGAALGGERNSYEGNLSDSALGSVASFMRAVRGIEDQIERGREHLVDGERKRTEIEAILGRGFEHGEELERLRSRLGQIAAELGIGRDEEQTAMASADEEDMVIRNPKMEPVRPEHSDLAEWSRAVEPEVPDTLERPWLVDRAELALAVARVIEVDGRSRGGPEREQRARAGVREESGFVRAAGRTSGATAEPSPPVKAQESEPSRDATAAGAGVPIEELRHMRDRVRENAGRVRRVVNSDGAINREREASRGSEHQLGLFGGD